MFALVGTATKKKVDSFRLFFLPSDLTMPPGTQVQTGSGGPPRDWGWGGEQRRLGGPRLEVLEGRLSPPRNITPSTPSTSAPSTLVPLVTVYP